MRTSLPPARHPRRAHPASIGLRAQVERAWEDLEHLTTGGLTAAQQDQALQALQELEDNLLRAQD
jgi:hypothetical protein